MGALGDIFNYLGSDSTVRGDDDDATFFGVKFSSNVWFSLCYFLSMSGAAASCGVTMTSVICNLVLYQIPDDGFAEYMQRIGNTMQHVCSFFTLCIFWDLLFSWGLMAFCTLEWPFNFILVCVEVPALLLVTIAWKQSVYVAY